MNVYPLVLDQSNYSSYADGKPFEPLGYTDWENNTYCYDGSKPLESGMPVKVFVKDESKLLVLKNGDAKREVIVSIDYY